MARSFDISKKLVWQAYLRVKANKGAEGIDGQTMEGFEQNLKGNLYKIWTRMSSGSYIPPAVMAVTIEKRSGGTRLLGIPTISDRIAQTVVKMTLEPELEPHFHEDSYGYRPGKSAIQAVAVRMTLYSIERFGELSAPYVELGTLSRIGWRADLHGWAAGTFVCRLGRLPTTRESGQGRCAPPGDAGYAALGQQFRQPPGVAAQRQRRHIGQARVNGVRADRRQYVGRRRL